ALCHETFSLCAPRGRRAYTTTTSGPSRPLTGRKMPNRAPLCRRAAEAREVGRKLRQRGEDLVRMNLLRARQQDFFALGDVRIGDAAIHRADGGAGFLVVEA